jgi:hypothetical protein
MKNLIIGKNSKIVNEIYKDLKNIDLISHVDIDSIEFNKYQNIFLFSWSHKNQQENLDIISKLPLEKTVLISTTAVYSYLVRKQWAAYPQSKSECENIVYSAGGGILRIGVWGLDQQNKIYGPYQLTTKKNLAEKINNWQIPEGRICNLYDLAYGKLSGTREKIAKLMGNISLRLPSKMICQLPFILTGRILKYSNYGYSGDAMNCCVGKLLIGYGAFGGYLYSKKLYKIDKIITSKGLDFSLGFNGFKNTLIGKSRFGLSSKWHGVYIENLKGRLSKRILRNKNNRSLPIDKCLGGNILSIIFKNDTFKCSVDYKNKNIHNYYAEKSIANGPSYEILADSIILSAGPIENARILNTLEKININFDDHELALVGELDVEEVNNSSIKCMGPLIFYKNTLEHQCEKYSILLDFRPKVDSKINENLIFYNESSKKIIFKLFKKLNFPRLNEAFFNRFKVGIKTKKLQLYAQVLVRDCIKFEDGKLSRERISRSDWGLICQSLANVFKTFEPYHSIISIDAQHIWSSNKFKKGGIIDVLQNEGKLQIFGSPSSDVTMTNRHHTHQFRQTLYETLIAKNK